MRSVDGHPLPFEELKGTKQVEAIDLSRKGLGVASGIIIADCIKGNTVLKELKYATAALCHTVVSLPSEHLHFPALAASRSAISAIKEDLQWPQPCQALL